MKSVIDPAIECADTELVTFRDIMKSFLCITHGNIHFILQLDRCRCAMCVLNKTTIFMHYMYIRLRYITPQCQCHVHIYMYMYIYMCVYC